MTDSRMVWDLDVRVRDRNLKTGVLKTQDVVGYFDSLADSAKNAESLALHQPGFAFDEEVDLDASHCAAAGVRPIASAEQSADSEFDEEDEDDDDF